MNRTRRWQSALACAWHDLAPEDRVTAARETMVLRQMEAALDPDGLSTTARSVLARINRR